MLIRGEKMGFNISNKIIGAIAIVVITVVLLSLTPTIIDEVEVLDAASSTWNFTGASGAASILGLVPFVWIAAILISAAVGMFWLSKGGK